MPSGTPATGAERDTLTNERGDFVFASLAPGDYTVIVSADGFKRTEKTDVQLSASEVLSTGKLRLEVGSLAESITVKAEGAAVQTVSAERSGTVTNSQVENLLIRSRTVMALLQLMPGVVDQSDQDSIGRDWNINVNGNRRNTSAVSLDGMAMNAIGNNNNALVGVSQDAVAEVKILSSNYQAEFGRMSGANIQIVTKCGTQSFHGLGSYFKRHEQFNANNFFNNRLGQVKPRYRYNTWTYNVGGPIYIPKHFNTKKEKLFFFFNQEYWPLRVSQPLAQLTVPTELERAGDFSQSLDLNNRQIVDPRSGQQPPAVPRQRDPRQPPRSQRPGAARHVLPCPTSSTAAFRAGRYNYVFNSENRTPQRTETLKLDYNINSSNFCRVQLHGLLGRAGRRHRNRLFRLHQLAADEQEVQ